MLRAVYIQDLELYRIYDDENQNNTIAYVEAPEEYGENIEIDRDR